MENIIIVGGGGHSKSIISVIKRSNLFNVIGYTDIVDKGKQLDVNYLGNDSILEKYFTEGICFYAAIGVGQVNMNNKRIEIIERVSKIGYKFPQIISTNSIIGQEVEIGSGTAILDGVVVNSGTRIGNFTIINTGAIIDHDCIIGNYSHIATGAVLSGGVNIGEKSMVGAGAIIIQYQTIGTNCMIGAGATVCCDCIESGTYFGTPAKRHI